MIGRMLRSACSGRMTRDSCFTSHPIIEGKSELALPISFPNLSSTNLSNALLQRQGRWQAAYSLRHLLNSAWAELMPCNERLRAGPGYASFCLSLAIPRSANHGLYQTCGRVRYLFSVHTNTTEDSGKIDEIRGLLPSCA